MVDSCQPLCTPKNQQPTTTNKQQQKLLKRIRKCKAGIENLKTLPYYTVFNQRAQQEKDIAKAEAKLFRLQCSVISIQSQLAVLSMSEASDNRQPTKTSRLQSKY